jgi:hypothetical protein
MSFRRIQAVLTLCVAMVLVACGGGGGSSPAPSGGSAGGTGSSGGTTTTVTTTAGLAGAVPFFPLTITDSGGVSGGDGANGDSGADGSAGDGERVKLSFNFAALTGNWRVVDSAYGITGQTGTFTMVLDPSKGGYRYVGATTPQQNIYVSRAGVVTGSLPLRINGVQRASKFVALLNSQLATTLDGITGTYNIGYTDQNPADAFGFTTVIGSMRIKPDGSFRICPFAGYSDTCSSPQGVTFTVGTLQPSSTEAGKFNVTVNGQVEGVASALNHAYGRTLIWDYIKRSSTGTVLRTGSRVAAVQLVPAPSTAVYQGNWINSIKSANYTIGGTATPGSDSIITASLVATANNTGLIYASDPSVISGGGVTGCQTSTNVPISVLPGSFGELQSTLFTPSTSTNVVGSTTITTVSLGITQSSLLLPLGADSFSSFYVSTGRTVSTFYNGVLQPSIDTSGDFPPFYSYGYIRRLSSVATFCR